MKIDYWQNFEEGCYYHIYNHAVNEQNIFNIEKDYTDFLAKHYKYLSCAFDTIAYCLMPNHFHFVVKVKRIDIILENSKNEKSKASNSFQRRESDVNTFILDQYRRFFSSYSLSYNFRYNRKGQVFLKRFKRVSLDSDTRLLYMICYLHHNPIHHRYTKDYKSWIYSSYNNYITESPSDIYDDIINGIFAGIENFIKIHKEFRLNQKEVLNLDL